MDIPALPFSKWHKTVSKPYGSEYIYNPTTLGEKIKNRRIELGLFQREVAELLEVSDDTIILWENETGFPLVQYFPSITQFLGYFPFTVDVSTLGGRITGYRYRHGLTPKEFGKLIEANASTVRAWEEGKHMPSKSVLSKVEQMITL